MFKSYILTIFITLLFAGCGGESSQAELKEPNKSRNLERSENGFDDRALKRVQSEDISDSDKSIFEKEERFALVIGNNNYSNFTTLKNARKDSKDIGDTLQKLGFQVFRVEDGDRDEMNRKIQQFANLLKKRGGVGMLFYAGHGLEIGGVNYLVPVDADVKDKIDIKNESVSLNDILYRLEEAGNRLNIVVLDACRNDPIADGSLFRSTFGNGGLATPPTAKGTYIAYSADVGQSASDGEGKNGVFTKHLLANIEKEGVKLNDIFKLTRQEVEAETDGAQSPASYDKTTGDFYFVLPKKKSLVIGERVENGISVVTIGASSTLESDVKISDGKAEEFQLQIYPYPSDSEIEFIEKDLKYSPKSYYKKGKYRLRVSHKGYFSQEVEVYLDRNIESSINLQKSEFSLSLLTNPIDAKISLLGISQKYSDGITLQKGIYRLRVEAERYYPKEVEINLERDTLLEVNLQQYLFSLTVNPLPEDSQISITNIEPKYRDGIVLEGGKYTVKVKRDGYTPKIAEIDLKRDTVLDISLSKVGETLSKSLSTSGTLVWSGKDLKNYTLSGSTFREVLSNLELSKLGDYRAEEKEFPEKFYFKEFSFPEFVWNKSLAPRDMEFETEGEYRSRKSKFERERDEEQEKWERSRRVAQQRYFFEKEEAQKEFEDRKRAFQREYKRERDKKLIEIREAIFKEREAIFNSWLGEQKISMRYNPEKAQFSVKEESFGFEFDFPVPRESAREFKESTKNFDFIFQERGDGLTLIGVRAGGFSRELQIDISNHQLKERELIDKIYVDKSTNLMWQKNGDGTMKTWQNATSYCENLNLAGFSDWRLPTRDEAKSLLTYYYGTLDNYNNWSNWFNNNKNRRYNERFTKEEISQFVPKWIWTSTKYNSSGSWIVSFHDGIDLWDVHDNSNHVVCVRDL